MDLDVNKQSVSVCQFDFAVVIAVFSTFSLQPTCLERLGAKHSSLRVGSRHRVAPVPPPVGHRAPASLPQVLGLSVPWTLFPLRSFHPSLRTRSLKSWFLSLGVDSLRLQKVSATVVCASCNKLLGFFVEAQKSSERLAEEQCLFIFKLGTSKFRSAAFCCNVLFHTASQCLH